MRQELINRLARAAEPKAEDERMRLTTMSHEERTALIEKMEIERLCRMDDATFEAFISRARAARVGNRFTASANNAASWLKRSLADGTVRLKEKSAQGGKG